MAIIDCCLFAPSEKISVVNAIEDHCCMCSLLITIVHGNVSCNSVILFSV